MMVLNSTTDVYNDGLEYTYTPTANTLWISHFGMDRVAQPSFSKTPDPTSFGFPAILNQNGVSRMPAILPNSNGDYSRFTPLFSQCCVDTKFAHTLLNYSSAFSWTHGRHSFKFGGEQRLFYNNFFQPNYPTGLFSFDPTVSSPRLTTRTTAQRATRLPTCSSAMEIQGASRSLVPSLICRARLHFMVWTTGR